MSSERDASGKQTDGVPPSVRHDDAAACPVPAPPDLSGVTVVALRPQVRVGDYLEAMPLAGAEVASALA